MSGCNWIKFYQELIRFKPCAYAQFALRSCFLSVRPSIRLSVCNWIKLYQEIKGAATVYTNTRSCPPGFPKLALGRGYKSVREAKIKGNCVPPPQGNILSSLPSQPVTLQRCWCHVSWLVVVDSHSIPTNQHVTGADLCVTQYK